MGRFPTTYSKKLSASDGVWAAHASSSGRRCRAGTDSFDIANGRIRAIHVVRNPDKLRGFLEHSR
jgi:hypothetical protein